MLPIVDWHTRTLPIVDWHDAPSRAPSCSAVGARRRAPSCRAPKGQRGARQSTCVYVCADWHGVRL